jgi:hypothetical protein
LIKGDPGFDDVSAKVEMPRLEWSIIRRSYWIGSRKANSDGEYLHVKDNVSQSSVCDEGQIHGSLGLFNV